MARATIIDSFSKILFKTIIFGTELHFKFIFFNRILLRFVLIIMNNFYYRTKPEVAKSDSFMLIVEMKERASFIHAFTVGPIVKVT